MWEAKAADPRYALYHSAINDGLAKLFKYYSKFDSKPAYILVLGKLFLFSPHVFGTFIISQVLHPYFKMQYIQKAWGGAEEQAAERAAGNKNTKNWHDEALKIVEDVVRYKSILLLIS